MKDTLKPLSNRALQGIYSPGSTFKIAVATAALEEGIVTPDFQRALQRRRELLRTVFPVPSLKGGHGTVDMRHAIEKSCNVYFYTLGNMLGVDRIHKWASALGLGERSGHRSAERSERTRAVDRVEAAREEGEMVRRRDDLGGDRTGPGVGDAALAWRS